MEIKTQTIKGVAYYVTKSPGFRIHPFYKDHKHTLVKLCIVSNFYWVLQSSQEKSKTMVKQFFFAWVGGRAVGQTRFIMVYMKIASFYFLFCFTICYVSWMAQTVFLENHKWFDLEPGLNLPESALSYL